MVLELLFEYGEHESSSVAQILNVVQMWSRYFRPNLICHTQKSSMHTPSAITRINYYETPSGRETAFAVYFLNYTV